VHPNGLSKIIRRDPKSSKPNPDNQGYIRASGNAGTGHLADHKRSQGRIEWVKRAPALPNWCPQLDSN